MAYIGKTPTIGNFQKCDAISVVNGQASYTMQVGGTNVSPESENHMLVSLNGILQAPVDSFTVSGSTITFASNLQTGDVIDFIMLLGNVLDLGVPSDNTVSTAKIVDNAVTYAKASGFGKLLQVVSSGAINQSVTATDTSYTLITGHSLSITPSSTSSKIFILMSFSARSNSNVESHYSIFRGSTNLGSADGFITLHDDNTGSDNENQCTLHFLDSPNTTSETTYSLRGKTDNASNSYRVNVKGNDSVITLFEIGG